MIETGRTVQPAPGDDILTTADGYARFDPARNRWDSMQAPTRAVAKGQTIDHHAVFDGEPGAPLLAYDGRADRWDSLPAPPAAGTLIWTGTDLWSVAGGGPAGRPGGVYRYRPS